MLKTRTQRIAAAGLVVVLLIGVAGWWLFIRDDAPEEANLEDAQAAAEADAEDESGVSGDDDEGSATTLAGAWTVDTEVESSADVTSPFVGYRIQEELASIGANEAVGRTSEVTGSITVDGDQVTEGSIEADMTTLQSDQDMRDNQLRGRGLETDAFPTASFTLTEAVTLPDDAASGEEFSFTATGDLTLHGVTRPVSIEFAASLTEGRIVIAGQADIVLADYEIEPPEGFSVVSVADEGTFEFQLFLSRS